MAKEIASMTIQCTWIEDPETYELLSTTNDIRFDASGNPSRGEVSVSAFRIRGVTRSALPVNSQTGADHIVALTIAVGTGSAPSRSLSAGVYATALRSAAWARFDLVHKSKVTMSGTTPVYAESDVVASLPVFIQRDGANGSNGSFISTVFVRSATKPATPTGGSYSSPYPTTKVNGNAWTDAPTTGTDPIWISRAIITPSHTTTSPTWSDPVMAVDSNDVEFIWSTSESAPTLPTAHPFDAANPGEWSKDATDAVWMAVAIKRENTWGEWQRTRIKGEKADATPVISITPAVVALKKGKPRVVDVYVDVDAGLGRLAYQTDFMCSTLSSSATVAQGLFWGFSVDGGRFRYTLNYSGTTTVNMDIPVTVQVKGVAYERAITVQTTADGEAGVGISDVTNYYAVSASNAVAPTGSAWKTEVQQMTATLRYLWNKEVVTLTDGSQKTTQPRVIGVYGDSGRGISTITEYYLATSAATGVTADTTGWTTTVQTVTAAKKYLWNYETVSYTDGSSDTSDPVIIGVYGDKGDTGDKGDPGQNAVQYSLLLDPASVKYDLSQGKYDTDNVAVRVVKTTGRSVAELPQSAWAAEGITLHRQNVKGDGTTEAENTCTGAVGFSGSTYRYRRIDLILRKDGTEVDRRSLDIVSDGESVTGPVGPYCPPPQMWQDYPDNFLFEDGSAGCSSKHSVYCDFEADGRAIVYECVRTHRKGHLTNASGGKVDDTPSRNCLLTGANKVWNRASTTNVLSTILMLAKHAYIDLLSSQGIRIYNQSGQIVGQMAAINGDGAAKVGSTVLPFFVGGVMQEDGLFQQNPLFAVGTNGKTYHGGIAGQRIEIDPASKRMLVYDSAGTLCAIHSGETLDWQTVGNATGSSSASRTASELNKSLTGAKTEHLYLAQNLTAGGSGTLSVSIPKFLIRSDGTAYGDEDFYAACTLDAEVLFGDEVVERRTVGGVADLSHAYTTPDAVAFSMSIPKGTQYSVRLAYRSNVNETGHAYFTAQGSATAGLTVQNKVCHYGANGWYISTDNRNYSYCIFDSSGKMHYKVCVDGTVMFDTDTSGKHF